MDGWKFFSKYGNIKIHRAQCQNQLTDPSNVKSNGDIYMAGA